MKKLKILSVILTAFVLAISAASPAGAVSFPNDVKTLSESILLVNMDTDQVVFEKEADAKRYPASTTKIMTYIVAYEHIQNPETTRIPIKKEVLDNLENTGSSLANVADHVGKTMSAIDLFYSMMVPSGNDAAVVLADYVGEGSIDRFVEMMNDKAKELGCNDTHFTNPDGLHDEEHYTTARDMYKMTTYALTLDNFEEITNTTTYDVEGEDYPIVTTNLMIDQWRGGELYYMYAKGIKTGSTDEAGRCLVTTASADGYSYMAVLLKAPYKEGEDEEYYTMIDAADLFRWSLTSLEIRTIKTVETPVCEQKVKLAWGKDSVTLVPAKNLTAVVPKDIGEENIVVETDVPEVAEAPLNTNTKIGVATVYYRADEKSELQELAKVDLVPSENIEMSGFLKVLDVMGTILQSYWFLVIIGIIAVVLLLYFISSKISSRKRRKNRSVKRYRNL